ncbi:MAG: TIGR04388 family protein [Leptospira sp.]|nr:TIGR04388 family protein [Leptospira sp.]
MDAKRNEVKIRRMKRLQKARFGIIYRVISFAQLTTFLFMILAGSFVPLFSQPVPVPNLVTPNYQHQNMSPFFQNANISSDAAGWDSITGGGFATLRAQWEAQADLQINNYVASINTQDVFNSVQEYQDYVFKAMTSEKQEAELNWTSTAEADIIAQRNAFIVQVANNVKQDVQTGTPVAINQSSGTVNNIINSTSGTPDTNLATAQNQLTNDQLAWLRDYKDALRTGNQQFSDALNQNEASYDTFMNSLNQTDADYQSNLAQIQSYEDTVRNGIGNTIGGLQNYLNTSGLFYNESCSGTSCSTDMTTLNAAGQSLLALINTINADLQNNTPLATITQQLTTYMATRLASSQSTVSSWSSQSYGSNNAHSTGLSYDSFGDPRGQSEGNSIGYEIGSGSNIGAKKNSTAGMSDIIRYIDTGNVSYIASLMGETRTITAVTTADVCGVTTNGRSHGHDCYSSARDNAFTYTRVECGGFCGDSFWYESRMLGTVGYNWRDDNAVHNTQIWQGYTNDLTPVLANWQNNLLPAIQNWEAQANQYKAQYATWQAQAQVEAASAQASYMANLTQISQEKSAWLTQMAAEKATGDAKWSTLQQSLDNVKTNSGSGQEPKINLSAMLSAAPSGFNAPAGLTTPLSILPQLSDDFLNQSQTTLTDSTTMQNFLGQFQNTMKGLKNLAYAETMNADAVKTRQDGIKEMVANIRGMKTPDPPKANESPKQNGSQGETTTAKNMGDTVQTSVKNGSDASSTPTGPSHDTYQNVGIDSDGNISMSMETVTSEATLRDGGDSANSNDYKQGKSSQKITIAPPKAIALADTGSLFNDWDMESISNQFNNNKNAFQKEIEQKYKTLSDQTEAIQKNNEERTKEFNKNVEDKVAEAQMINSLIQTLATGGTINSFVQSQVQGKISEALEKTFGLPGGFLTSLMGGMKPHLAAKQYFEGQMWAKLDEVSGIPGLTQVFQAGEAKKAKKAAAKKQQMETVVTVAAVGASFFTGGASLVALSAMKAAQGYAAGGLKGAALGAASGAIKGFTGSLVTVDLSYSYADGYGASVGVGVEGVGSVGVGYTQNGGASVNATLKAGPVKAGVSYSQKDGFGANVGFTSSSSGTGVAAGLNYSKKGGVSAYAGVSNTSDTGKTNTAGIGYSKDKGVEAYVSQGAVKLTYGQNEGFGVKTKLGNDYGGIEAGYTQKGGFTASVKMDLGKLSGDPSLNGVDAGVSYNSKEGFSAVVSGSIGGSSFNAGYSAKNGFTASSSRIPANSGFITSISDLEGATDSMAAEQQKELMDKKKLASLQNKGMNISEDDWNSMDAKQKSDLLHNTEEALPSDDFTDAHGTSRDENSFSDNFFGGIQDSLGSIVGTSSDADGFIDAQGNYNQRTCFVAGTLITVEPKTPGAFEKGGNWFKKIEDIKAGDRVLSWNEKSGVKSFNRVNQTFVRTANQIYRITYQDGNKVETTWNHPFYIEGKGWVQGKDLVVGDHSTTANGALVGIVSIAIDNRNETVYNFEVEGNHTYFVTETLVLVHNDCQNNLDHSIFVATENAGDFTKENRGDKIIEVPGKNSGKNNIYRGKIDGIMDPTTGKVFKVTDGMSAIVDKGKITTFPDSPYSGEIVGTILGTVQSRRGSNSNWQKPNELQHIPSQKYMKENLEIAQEKSKTNQPPKGKK